MTLTKSVISCALALGVGVASAGCFLFDDLGMTSLGRFAVEARLVADSCGPGTVDGDPLMHYEVELRKGGTTVTWDGPGAPRQGTLGADDQFCISDGSSWHVRDADPWSEDPGCDMTRIERLCAVLERVKDPALLPEGEPVVTSLTGHHELFLSGAAGSDCSDQLGLAEGQYLTLPCQVTYDLVGQAIE